MSSVKRAVIVAHPDDEVLWGAGIVLRHPGDWTIICASVPRADPIRAEKFFDSCDVLGATPYLHRIMEPVPTDSMNYLDEIDLSEYEHIVTHNALGEYGHQHHKDVHRYVYRRYGKKKLTFFGYSPGARGGHEIHLTDIELARKMKALKCYDHVLPYNGKPMPKWEALYQRYITEGGISFNVETYDGALP